MSEDLGNTSLRVLRGQVLVELVEQQLNRSLQEGDEMQVRPRRWPGVGGHCGVTHKWVWNSPPPAHEAAAQLWGLVLVELVEQHLNCWLWEQLPEKPWGGWGPHGVAGDTMGCPVSGC